MAAKWLKNGKKTAENCYFGTKTAKKKPFWSKLFSKF
jgi:hypothetical protein